MISGMKSFQQQILHYTVPNSGVCTAGDIGFALADCTPVDNRGRQLKIKKQNTMIKMCT